MPINYIVTKKIDTTGDTPKELYYATSKAMQKRGQGIDVNQLAHEMAERSSLSEGDVLSVLKQLPDRIIDHLKFGRTVNIGGLGTFMVSLTSDGFATPEEVTVDKVRISRVCFRADNELAGKMQRAKFVSMQLQQMREMKDTKKEQRDTNSVSK